MAIPQPSLSVFARIQRTALVVGLTFVSSLAPFSAHSSPLPDRCKNLVTKEDFDAFAKSISSEWKEIADEYRWRIWIDTPIDLQRFINPLDYAQLSTRAHGTEAYQNGLAQYRGMLDGIKHLNSIPVGKLELSAELFQETHRIMMRDVYSLKEKIAYKVGRGLFNVTGPGKFKTFFNFGFPPEPLTDAQVEMIRTNPYTKFLSFFRSGADKNHGWIIFPGSPREKVEELIQWYNSNKDRMSPIQLAAGFQRRFISIHPFDNGNGRLSRVLMDRILKEYGLPPVLLRDHNLDLYVSEADWAKEIAAGVAQFQTLAKEAIRHARKTKLFDVPPFIGERDHVGYIRLAEGKEEWISSELYPGAKKASFKAGDGGFYQLFKDGFIYSENGIPHVFIEGKLQPIPEQNYLLYAMGGKLSDAPLPKDHYRRTLSPQHEEAFRSNLALLHRIHEGEIPPNSIQVEAYRTIRKANDNGELQLRPWEKGWLRGAIEIKDETPGAILARNRGGFTEFEQAFIRKGNVRISSILAQYQSMDLNYARLEHYFRKESRDAEMLRVVEESRKKLWSATRHYLQIFEDKAVESLSKIYPEITDRGQLLEKIKASPKFKLFYEYLPYTRAGYASWDEAVSEIPSNRIYLLRNDFKAVRWSGFMPEKTFSELMSYIPGARRFRDYVRKRVSGLKGSSSSPEEILAKTMNDEDPTSVIASRSEADRFDQLFEAIDQKIFLSRYENRGAHEEFERMYVDLYLHATDIGLKRGVSFSVRTDQMVRDDGALAFAGINGVGYKTYIVEIPVQRALNNFASGWFRQYEVVAGGFTLPTKIKKSFDEKSFTPDLSLSNSAEFQKFVKSGQLIRIEE